MENLTADFYKRYTHDTGCAESVKCPAAVMLFGVSEAESTIPALSLALSFGAEAAYRARTDGRIVLSRTDSDALKKINVIDIEKFSGDNFAKEIFCAIKRLPLEIDGIELLLHSDVCAPELAPRKLCAVKAAAAAFGDGNIPRAVLRAAGYPAYHIVSLLDNVRAAAVNTSTLEYLSYNFSLKGRRIILARLRKKQRVKNSSFMFYERERKRINRAAAVISEENIDLLGMIMREASLDILSEQKNEQINMLFEYASEYTPAVKIATDFNGIIAFVDDCDTDNFIKTVGEKYENNSGSCPEFYISD